MTRPADKNRIVSKVNTTPRALQSLLGNVNQGINPHELDHRISPNVDLYPHWAANSLRSILNSQSIAGTVGQGITEVVPDGETWQVIAASVTKVKASTTTEYDLAIQLIDPSQAAGCSIFSRQLKPYGITAGIPAVGGLMPDRFLLPSGWGIRGQVMESNNNPNTTMTLRIIYILLDL